jgi:septum site-determining protein MinC
MTHDSLLQFKGTQLKIIQALLRSTDLEALHSALGELTDHSPDFFENELAILDFSTAEDLPANVDWQQICTLFRQSGLNVVATRGLPDELAASAVAAGLPGLPMDALGRPQRAKAEAETTPLAVITPVATGSAAQPEAPPAEASEQATAPAPSPASEREAPPRTITLDKPLRSGQRFYARGCDLIVTAMISAGAEVIADGNIHIYAPLRGRALAGASGDSTARIFTTCMEAELVSIAGLYRTFENGVPADLARQPSTISLIDEGGQARLNVMPLALK